jgi:hypothetical protein
MIRESMPGIDDTKLDSIIKHMKTELEADPYALLQPIEPGNAGAQLNIMKGYSLETAMYLAALTGAVLYTDLKAHWQQLHLHTSAADPARVTDSQRPIADAARAITVPIEIDWTAALEARISGKFGEVRTAMRRIVECVRDNARESEAADLASQLVKAAEAAHKECATSSSAPRLNGRVEISVPDAGFERNKIRRLLLTFGRAEVTRLIPAAFFTTT